MLMKKNVSKILNLKKEKIKNNFNLFFLEEI
jgi:hypothetical protein